MSQRPYKKITLHKKATKYSKGRKANRKDAITKEINARIVDEFIDMHGEKKKGTTKK